MATRAFNLSTYHRSMKYVEYSGEQENSLRYLTGVQLNTSVHCRHWSIDQQDGSSSVWRCVKTDRTDTPGDLVTDSTYGLLYIGEGESGSRPGWAFTPAAGNRADIRAFGVKCDGIDNGQHSLFAKIVSACKVRGWTITGGGVFRISETIDVRDCFVDFSAMKIQAGTNVSSSTAPGLEGDFCPFAQKTVGSITTGTPGTINIVAHGFSDGAAVDVWTSGTVPSGLSTNITYYVVNSATDSFQLATTVGGSAISVSSAGTGTHYVGKHFPNMTVMDIVQWDGSLKRYGVAVRAGGVSSARNHMEQKIRVWGDGNFDFTTISSAVQIRWEDTAGANTHFTGYVSYGGIAHCIYGQLEKHHVDFHGYYCDHLCYAYATGNTSDTLQLNLHGGVCRHWYWEIEGSDTSILPNFNCENRTDPGDGSPAVWIRNGKFTKLSGEFRANNGDLGVLIDKTTNIGTDTVHFADLTFIHGYGCFIEFRRCRNVSGTVMIKDVDDGPSSGAPDTNPAVWIKRVVSMGSFVCSIFSAKTREGIRIGDDTNDWYPYEANLGRWTIHMGTDAPWNTNGTEKGTGFPTVINGSNPSITACVVEKAKGGKIVFDQIDGLIDIGAAVVAGDEGKFQAVIPRQGKRYTHVNAASGEAEVVEASYTVIV